MAVDIQLRKCMETDVKRLVRLRYFNVVLDISYSRRLVVNPSLRALDFINNELDDRRTGNATMRDNPITAIVADRRGILSTMRETLAVITHTGQSSSLNHKANNLVNHLVRPPDPCLSPEHLLYPGQPDSTSRP